MKFSIVWYSTTEERVVNQIPLHHTYMDGHIDYVLPHSVEKTNKIKQYRSLK